MKRFTYSLLCTLALALFACTEPKAEQAQPFEKEFPMSVGGKKFMARIAVEDVEKSHGLMFVKELPPDSAMIFVNFPPVRASFWMKNTFIPLDIGFFDSDGVLTEVKKMYPHNLDTVYSSLDNIAYCIETNANWFEKNGIKSGDKLDMELLNAAMAARKAPRKN